jgi:hypothetical protein
MITSGPALVHWNYFVALTQDLERISRYIEFHEENYSTYSVELAHLLLSASSEIDVVSKLLCDFIDPATTAENINHYRDIITGGWPAMVDEKVYIPRYNLVLDPWENWRTGTTNPDWWQSYNKVKHERNAHFSKANLKNTLNSMAALLVVIVHYYARFLEVTPESCLLKETTIRLSPFVEFIRLDRKHHYSPVLG